jgi:hypothetical protein
MAMNCCFGVRSIHDHSDTISLVPNGTVKLNMLFFESLVRRHMKTGEAYLVWVFHCNLFSINERYARINLSY